MLIKIKISDLQSNNKLTTVRCKLLSPQLPLHDVGDDITLSVELTDRLTVGDEGIIHHDLFKRQSHLTVNGVSYGLVPVHRVKHYHSGLLSYYLSDSDIVLKTDLAYFDLASRERLQPGVRFTTTLGQYNLLIANVCS